jgi:hypothetical protein
VGGVLVEVDHRAREETGLEALALKQAEIRDETPAFTELCPETIRLLLHPCVADTARVAGWPFEPGVLSEQDASTGRSNPRLGQWVDEVAIVTHGPILAGRSSVAVAVLVRARKCP